MRLFKRSLMLNLVDEAGDGIDLGDLSVLFRVSQTNAQELNRAVVEVYNLSVDTIARLDSELQLVDLIAGYGDTTGRIFRGNVNNVFTRQEGPDRITEIYAQDGLRGYTRSIAKITLSSGHRLRDLVETIVAAFPDEIDVTGLDNLPDISLVGSHAFLAPTRSVLEMLAESYGFTWFIHNHTLRIFGSEQVDRSDPVPVNFESGLIGSPIVSAQRLEFTTLLNAAIHPAGSVEVTSVGPQVQESEVLLAGAPRRESLFGIDGGVFRVSEVEHVGETRGQAWYSKVVCHPFSRPLAAA